MAGSTTEAIKEKLDIVDFLRGYLEVQPAGKNFKARCPFHKEKTPSFMISPDRQSWHCFGCGIGGDAFAFLMRYENIEFGEALRILAEKTGVELRRLDPAEHKFTGLLYELNEKAKDFFKKSLASAPVVKKYLAERGLAPETIEEFELGWAPNESEALSMQLLTERYAPEDIMRAGLALKSERGMMFDRFRGRIMFPIHNHFGRVVGFTGRVLPQFEGPEVGKYVNSPETPIFNKSKLLYGFWKSKNAIREAGAAFLVEGQMDFLMSYQAGVRNAVASSGTALTADHLRVLRRLADEVILSFDSDAAGAAAAERAIDLAEANDLGVKVVSFGVYKDPAEAVQAGPDVLAEAVKKAVPAPRFYFDKYLSGTEAADYAGRSGLKNLRIVISKLKNIASAVARDFWFKELAKRTGIDEQILFEEASRVEPAKRDAKLPAAEDDAREAVANKLSSRKELLSEELLRAAAAKNDFAIVGAVAPYLAATYAPVFEALRRGEKKMKDPTQDELMHFIVLGAAELTAPEIETVKQELSKEYLKERRQVLTVAVKRAESKGDDAALEKALKELSGLPVAAES
ncbi:MAG TPA: DNA primase [Candidatus Paceibacterota bacterium]|nr:DNA primase [Candidatus Paceibacterota bacterium]